MTTPVALHADARARSDVALVDLLDRLLATGVVLTGDIVISLAGIDLVEVRLNAVITSIRAAGERPSAPGGTPAGEVPGAAR